MATQFCDTLSNIQYAALPRTHTPYSCMYLDETEAALFVFVEARNKKLWIPKASTFVDTVEPNGHYAPIWIPLWLCRRDGL
jgi:hypothetical protein